MQTMQPQDSVRHQLAREGGVPPMTELISEAALVAGKQPPPSRGSLSHYTPQRFGPPPGAQGGLPHGSMGPMSHTVSASIEYDPAGPQTLPMMHPDMRSRAAATLPRPRSVDSISDHIYEAYKYRRAESGSLISESSSAEQLHTLGATSIATATLPLRVAAPPPPIAPKPNFAREPSMAHSETSAGTSHPVSSEETVIDSF